MQPIVAAIGEVSDELWRWLFQDLRLSSRDSTISWRSSRHSVAIAQRCKAQDGEALQIPVGVGGCTVFVDGWIGHVANRSRAAATQLALRYLRYGPRAFSSLEGDFAFVMIDETTGDGFVGSDPIGTRALCWCTSARGLVLASRAISAARQPTRPSDLRNWCPRYVAGCVLQAPPHSPEVTAFEGVSRIAPGVTMTFRVGAPFALRLLGGATPLHSATRKMTTIDDVADSIRAATARRVEDGSCALAYSGGLDSSVIAAAIAAHRVRTHGYVLVPEASALPSSIDRVRAVLPGLCVIPIAADEENGSEGNVVLTDDPVIAGPAMQRARLALYSRVAEDGFRSLLTGDGADEIFSIAWAGPHVMRRLPLRTAARALRRAARWTEIWRVAALASDLPEIVKTRIAVGWIRSFAASAPWLKRKFLDSALFYAHARASYQAAVAGSPHLSLRGVVQAMLRNLRAQAVVQASFGIEQRCPYVDPRVVATVENLPITAVVDARVEKRALQAVSARLLPSVSFPSKLETLDEMLRDRALAAGPAAFGDVVDFIASTPPLNDAVDVLNLERAMREWSVLPSSGRDRLFSLLSVAAWMRSVTSLSQCVIGPAARSIRDVRSR